MEEDYTLPIWAGVIPVQMQVGPPIHNQRNLSGVDIPEHVVTCTLNTGSRKK